MCQEGEICTTQISLMSSRKDEFFCVRNGFQMLACGALVMTLNLLYYVLYGANPVNEQTLFSCILFAACWLLKRM